LVVRVSRLEIRVIKLDVAINWSSKFVVRVSKLVVRSVSWGGQG
jgi:hypothetical protein